uniref:Uncharacterized protein n=1 Tax=Solanum tuberosum TaxID=4113 RepID=M1CXW0_SOLTU
MHINDINISCLMVHAQNIEEEKLKERSREEKRAKIDDGDFSHLRFERHDRSKFCQSFSGQGSSNASLKFKKDMVSNPKSQRGNGGKPSLSTCSKCGRKYEVPCWNNIKQTTHRRNHSNSPKTYLKQLSNTTLSTPKSSGKTTLQPTEPRPPSPANDHQTTSSPTSKQPTTKPDQNPIGKTTEAPLTDQTNNTIRRESRLRWSFGGSFGGVSPENGENEWRLPELDLEF